jgi:hypothetical protein
VETSESAGTSGSYRDRWIECTAEGILIRGYYFPWGTKHIPYKSVRSVERVEISHFFKGKGRIWGTANPHYWASLDPHRPKKKVGLVLDVGKRVKPFITPDDPDLFEAVLRDHAEIPPPAEKAGPSPFL